MAHASEAPTPPGVPRRIGQVFFMVGGMGALLFISCGCLDWPMAWIYMVSFAVAVAGSAMWLARANAEVLVARSKVQEGYKVWDRRLTTTIVLLGHPVTLIACGLDRRLAGANAFDLPVQVTALAVSLGGYAVTCWCMSHNRFFEGLVRIQTDRGHTVVSEGPYRFVRHPGYVGFLASFLATPFILDSRWALIPAAMASALLLVRTELEDRTLQAELPGYTEYAATVRYRLFPPIW